MLKVFNQVIDECFEDNTEEEVICLVGKWERQENRTVRHTARRCRREITITTDQSRKEAETMAVAMAMNSAKKEKLAEAKDTENLIKWCEILNNASEMSEEER